MSLQSLVQYVTGVVYRPARTFDSLDARDAVDCRVSE